MSIFKGCATALVTPFSDSGVDYDSLGRLIDFQIKNDVGALVILGTTGEAATMSEDEKIDVVKFSVKAADGRVPVIVGSGSNDTKSAVRLSRLFSSLGADALLVVTPFYNKCTQSGLVAHYSEIANSVDKPVIVYNVPARTGVNVLPETFRKLAKIKNVVAIKEAAGDLSQMSDMIMLSGDADVFSGDDNLPGNVHGGFGRYLRRGESVPEIRVRYDKNRPSRQLRQSGENAVETQPTDTRIIFGSQPHPHKIRAQ